MPFLLLLLLIVVYLPGKWPAPPEWVGARGSVLATWGATALLCGWAFFLAWRFQQQLARGALPRSAVVRGYSRWRKNHFMVLLTVYLAALYGLGWADTVRVWGTAGGQVVPGIEMLILAPFLTALILSWACFYSVERDLHTRRELEVDHTFPTRLGYLSVQVRHNFLLIVPPLLLMTVQQVILWLAPQLELHWTYKVLSAAMLVAVFLTLPWMLILLLGLKPLPAGSLRDRLLAAADRLGLRCRDILLWNTRKGMANALVTGILPRLRYVVVSDRLVADLTPEEVEAVFGHEAGHVKHHHLLYYLVFLLISMVVVGSFWEAISAFWASPPVPGPAAIGVVSVGGVPAWVAWPEEDSEDILAMMPLLVVLAGYIFVVFGLLSRRCERQADIYGCRAVSCGQPFCTDHAEGTRLVPRGRGLCATGIRTFISALEKVADVNGISRSRPGLLSSWQHSTIARRVEFLHRVRTDPALEPRFQRRVGLFKWGLLLGLGAALATLLAVLVWNGVALDRVWDSVMKM
jgi:Zn-dependent protease with chaperone function